MDSLLHEIQQAHKYDNERDAEFRAERLIREFVNEARPVLLYDLYNLVEAELLKNASTVDQISMFEKVLELVKPRLVILD